MVRTVFAEFFLPDDVISEYRINEWCHRTATSKYDQYREKQKDNNDGYQPEFLPFFQK